jgi:hypothetical protein
VAIADFVRYFHENRRRTAILPAFKKKPPAPSAFAARTLS